MSVIIIWQLSSRWYQLEKSTFCVATSVGIVILWYKTYISINVAYLNYLKTSCMAGSTIAKTVLNVLICTATNFVSFLITLKTTIIVFHSFSRQRVGYSRCLITDLTEPTVDIITVYVYLLYHGKSWFPTILYTFSAPINNMSEKSVF